MSGKDCDLTKLKLNSMGIVLLRHLIAFRKQSLDFHSVKSSGEIDNSHSTTALAVDQIVKRYTIPPKTKHCQSLKWSLPSIDKVVLASFSLKDTI